MLRNPQQSQPVFLEHIPSLECPGTALAEVTTQGTRCELTEASGAALSNSVGAEEYFSAGQMFLKF